MNTIKKIFAVIFTLFMVFPAFSYSKKDLLKAVEANDDSKVKKILSVNSNYSSAIFDSDKSSILMIALSNDPSIKMVDMLLKSGCSPDIRNKNDQTALMIACKYNCSSEILEKIINFNVFTKSAKAKRILLKDKDGKCCFDYTTENSEVYKTLISYAQDPSKIPQETSEEEITELQEEQTENTEEEISEQPAEKISEDNSAKEVQEPLEEEIPEPVAEVTETVPVVVPVPIIINSSETDETAENSEVPETAETENISEAEIPQVTEVSKKTSEEENSITSEPSQEQHSVEYDETVTVPKIDYYNKTRPEYLFEEIDTEVTDSAEKTFKKIENPNAADKNGRTRLMNAIMNDDTVLCYNLLESGARVDIRDKDGWTALMYACRYAKTPDIIQLLFNYGSKIKDKSTFNMSVLQIAGAFCQNKEVLNIILIQAQTEKLSLTDSFITALKTERSKEIIELYIKFIPNINTLNKGKTPLMYAAENYETTEVIKLLLENGADPYVISSENKNAFSYAKENSKIKHDSIYWSLNVSSTKQR